MGANPKLTVVTRPYLLEESEDDLQHRLQIEYVVAFDTRRLIEDRKTDYYGLYRAYRDDVPGGGQTESLTGPGRGPFNWSRLTIPIVFITVESFVSRLAPEAPTVTVTPLSVDAVPYAQAKQMRLNYRLRQLDWSRVMVRAVKDMSLMGDGFVKVTWKPGQQGRKGRPNIVNIPWSDLLMSPETLTMETAEWVYHRTWHTRRSINMLAGLKDENGNQMYQNLDDLTWFADRTTIDPTWARKRTLSGQQTQMRTGTDADQIAIVEGWNRDGTVVTFGWGGGQHIIIIRAVPNPYVTPDGDPWRPFVSFQNTPDPNSPYGISDAEMVEDMQREAQTVIDQSIDQAARNIMNPTFYDQQRISAPDIEAGLGQPGGLIAVDGNPADVLYQPPPPALSRDSEATINRIIQTAQMTSGITDESQYPFEGPRPGDDTGATGAWIRAQDRNRRVQYKLLLVSHAVDQIACRLDWIDQQFDQDAKNGKLVIPVDQGYAPGEDNRGIEAPEKAGGKVAVVKPIPAGSNDFQVKVDAGSLEAPFAGEQAQRAVQLAQTCAQFPQLAAQLNWNEMAKVLVEASDFEADRLLVPGGEAQPAVDQGAGAVPAPNGAQPAGAAVPVGPPQLVAGPAGGGATTPPAPPAPGPATFNGGDHIPLGVPEPLDDETGMPVGMGAPAGPTPPVSIVIENFSVDVRADPADITVNVDGKPMPVHKVIQLPDGSSASLTENPSTGNRVIVLPDGRMASVTDTTHLLPPPEQPQLVGVGGASMPDETPPPEEQ